MFEFTKVTNPIIDCTKTHFIHSLEELDDPALLLDETSVELSLDEEEDHDDELIPSSSRTAEINWANSSAVKSTVLDESTCPSLFNSTFPVPNFSAHTSLYNVITTRTSIFNKILITLFSAMAGFLTLDEDDDDEVLPWEENSESQ